MTNDLKAELIQRMLIVALMCCALAGLPSPRILVTKALPSLRVLTDTSLCCSFGGAAGFRCRDSIGSVEACRLEFEVLRSAVCQGSMQQPRLISKAPSRPLCCLATAPGHLPKSPATFCHTNITTPHVAFNLPEQKRDRTGTSSVYDRWHVVSR